MRPVRTAAAALIIVCACLSAGAAQARPPVWTIRDRDSVITVFGSVHALPAGLTWRPPALDRALRGADDIWFELPIDPAANLAIQRESAKQGFLPPGQSLTALLSRGGRLRLAKAATAFGLALSELDRMRPWYADLTLSSALYRVNGGDAGQGVEVQLAAAAPASARRRAFETPEDQIAAFASTPVRDQVASLEQTLRQIEQAPGDYGDLVRAWMAGDLKAVDREAVRPLRKAAPGLYANLVVRRNARWTDSIVERLNGSGQTVIVVGVGHLVGRDGIPARLRARGIQVEGPG